ncbi:type IX secretion/gliding motility protein PorT/SprT [Hanstruepera ponticola]|uniref:type IX secretion/gliding motility protein PorT/SprT n=1 Tax=Hanstruepera ponticola TaxID=2042995 RepID=UPI000CF07E0E|nr:porin family protein [Hanstruepera ponticola]
MKNIFVLLVYILTFQSVSAQLFSKEKIRNLDNEDKKFLSYGYFLGFNSYDFNFDYNEDKADILVQKGTGFNVGLIGNMRIHEHIDLRLEPGLYISTRNLEYDESYFNGVEDFTDSDLKREVQSTYIHVPLLLKFSTKRLNNFKPFVVGGVSTALNLSSNENNPDDNSSGQFRTKRNMYFYEIGFGIDFYLHYFKFTPSIRGVFAINDELVRDKDPNSPWTGNVNSMKTRGVFINFTFQ